MNEPNKFGDDIAAQAYHWVLNSSGNEPICTKVVSEFDEWLGRSPEHVRRYRLAATHYAQMKRLPPIASDQTME